MVRMIEKEASGKWQVRGIPWKSLRAGQTITEEMSQKIYGCFCKLKDYEDIGLNPDQIQSLLYQISDAGTYVCDKICRYPHEITDQTEMDGICAECQLGACIGRIEDLMR